ncbi:MAG: 3'-5' exonuclease [Gallionella sp.]|nr:3'-5' exonuclease [Gallionella sp.]MDD4958342.1 3'-5' exonuclease [Gallionella sp.]
MTPILIFDIETIPDIAGLRILHGLDDNVSDVEVAEMAFQVSRQRTGGDFVPHHLQRVVAISCVLRLGTHFKVWSLGDLGESEGSLIQRFFDGIEKYTPQLVSWNGGGCELPVLHYRGLIHGVVCPRYWDRGERDSNFEQNNYLNRDHTRYLDLMELLARKTENLSLSDFSKLIGLPAKIGMDSSNVWDAYQNGQLAEIRHDCELNALSTYLVFTRFQMMRGVLSRDAYQQECDLVRAELQKLNQAHLNAYLAAWEPTK